ncbi:MAG: amidohydrolase family protein [Clostridia bacterium]|nr:amidohydrolase family protein [Clostridia bacterium]
MKDRRIFHGDFVYSKSFDRLVEYIGGYLVVTDGVIEGLFDRLPDEYDGLTIEDFSGVMIPAFSDLHVHAPQYPNRGIFTDALLYDWLQKYTFPLEARYADPTFARAVYDAFVDDLLRHGTMHAVVFGTIHEQSTGYLLERLEEAGIDAYVGKVNMDTDSPESLLETVDGSLLATESFLDRYSSQNHAKPILTPRFAPTCSQRLLTGLGKLAEKYGVGVQTHLVESKWEAKESVRRHPYASCDTEIYERAGLLGHGPFVGAHFIFPSDKDVRILKKYDGYAVQCPDATTNVIAGIMPSDSLADRGVRLALGSDVSAGQSLAIYRQAASSVRLSKIKSFYEPDARVIPFSQAFFAATKGGGSLFGKVGSLEKGYSFDALVLDGLSDPFLSLTPAQTVERFCYAGDATNIRARYLRGKKI